MKGICGAQLTPTGTPASVKVRIVRSLRCGVSLAPQIPFLTEDMEQVLEAAWEAGAREAFYHVLRLPWEVAPLFRQWLQLHYPQRADRIMARVQDMRGGKDYDADFATRMKGTGAWAELIAQRFSKAANRIGFNKVRIELDETQFRPPGAVGQGQLF